MVQLQRVFFWSSKVAIHSHAPIESPCLVRIVRIFLADNSGKVGKVGDLTMSWTFCHCKHRALENSAWLATFLMVH